MLLGTSAPPFKLLLHCIKMAYEAQKTEHTGPKKGRGAYWGRKQAAKKESNRVRREADKNESKPVTDSDGKSKE